jgi:MFS family permease
MNRQLEWTLLSSYFLVLLFLEVGNPFLPLYLQSMVTVSEANLVKLSALVLSAPLIGLVLFSPVWGKLADIIGPKKMLLRANIALCIAQLLIALSYSAEMLIFTRFLQGVFSGLISAMQIYALGVCLPRKKGLMMSRLQGAQSLAQALGGLVGGLILLLLPFRAIYFMASLLTLGVIFIIWRYLPADTTVKKTVQKEKQSLSSVLLVVFILIFLSQLAKYIPHAVFAFYASNLTGNHSFLIGALYAAPALSIVLSTEISGRILDSLRQKVSNNMMCFSYFATLGFFAAIVLAIQSHSANLAIVFTCRLLWGLVLGALLPGLYVMLTEFGQARGYLLGLANSIGKCGNLSGVYIGAFSSAWLPFDQLFLLMALVYLLLGLVSVVVMMWEKRKRVWA